MRLFLCSHFAEVGSFLKGEVAGKNVVFVPTASINESYKGYVDSARKQWQKMNANIAEVEISTAPIDAIHKAFESADVIYFTGGNTFFLIDQLKKTGVDELIKKHLDDGKLYVGESGGAIVCAKELSYIKPMDEVPEDFSQKDYSGLNLIDFYVVPHYLCPPFEKCSQQILDEYPNLNICALNNSQAILVENGEKRKLNV
ncbi:Type 1 glutamine amidotransferase-like domain-containing protein [Fretibacterium sp. OH1220_COT-178]|uniref:Type 1 glutamine amidotransferase-like domain-containing protein n=1 Tax=Fretibacterium sp. OH1220_COT-178 TaxID=2491047 RepID=UPI000F5E5147|nr:Type 1 glutamine amidotransferase-like domain-containing protein [Fretibacterium sp. OH1220_COT-178]RRD63440.1 peptidase S51 [Fretibacterium sp. OH1220_COT-178]